MIEVGILKCGWSEVCFMHLFFALLFGFPTKKPGRVCLAAMEVVFACYECSCVHSQVLCSKGLL